MALTTGQTWAQGLWESLFLQENGCYARHYRAAHLAAHPVQRVSDIALVPDLRPLGPDERRLIVTLRLRGSREVLTATAYCDAAGAAALTCGLEGDGGGFDLTLAKDGAVLLTVGRHGMWFEGMADFVEIRSDRGDDRVFLLPRSQTCG